MNVVAVPPDYNNQKIRTCEYEVLEVCQNEIEKTYIPDDLADYEDYDLEDMSFNELGSLLERLYDKLKELTSEDETEGGVVELEDFIEEVENLLAQMSESLDEDEQEECDDEKDYDNDYDPRHNW